VTYIVHKPGVERLSWAVVAVKASTWWT
jgi:hypothetical protein